MFILLLVLDFLVSLLNNVLENTVSFRKRDLRLIPASDDNHKWISGSKLVSSSVFNSDQVVVSIELINILDDSNSSNIVTFHAISDVADFHFIERLDFVSSDIELDGVLNLNFLVKEFKGSSIVSDKITDFVRSDEFLLNSAEFEVLFSFLKFD